MNSLMQRYCNQATPVYAAAAAAAAAAVGRGVDGLEGCYDDDAAAAVTSSYSRRHRLLSPADHRSPALLPGLVAQSTSYLHSNIEVQNSSDCRQPVPRNPFADTSVQSTSSARCMSTRLSPLVPYEEKFAPRPHSGTASSVYGDYAQQLYDDSSLVADMNGHCGIYKVEQPSPSTTPNSERRAADAADAWNSSAYRIDNGEQNVSRVQTGDRKSEAQTPDRDKDLAPLDVCQSTTSDNDSDDVEAGSTSTKTSTTMTTEPDQHHQKQQQQQQQHMSTNSSCDVRQTQQRGVVLPIYPWMTRVHSTHGEFVVYTNIQMSKMMLTVIIHGAPIKTIPWEKFYISAIVADFC